MTRSQVPAQRSEVRFEMVVEEDVLVDDTVRAEDAVLVLETDEAPTERVRDDVIKDAMEGDK